MNFLRQCAALFLICASALAKSSTIEISAKGAEAEKAKRVLQGLLSKYDLKDYIYTDKVMIKSNIIPHSHPVLTLKAEEAVNPDELLGSFIHEQMHWFWIEKSPGRDIGPRVEFRKRYPAAPFKLPFGSGDESGTYQHIGVCWLEYQGLVRYLGKEKARKILQSRKYYTWVYQTVLKDAEFISQVMNKYGMDKPGH